VILALAQARRQAGRDPYFDERAIDQITHRRRRRLRYRGND
jgi:hypothetical protein